MNSYQHLWTQLIPTYDETEAKALIRTVLEVCYGLSLTDIVCGKVNELSAEDAFSLQQIIRRLQQEEPIQYILGCTDFCGHRFYVAPGVLIPRTETEQLCQWIINDYHGQHNRHTHILDVGTGSGCIAITLDLYIPHAQTTAWDISKKAIEIATHNNQQQKAKVELKEVDILNAPKHSMKWDIIVSNPPYICPSESKEMRKNVLLHEPHTALFVPENKPLMFYEAIAHYAIDALKPDGNLYFEINPLYVHQMEEMLKRNGFIDIIVKNDCFGKQRMMRATQTINH